MVLVTNAVTTPQAGSPDGGAARVVDTPPWVRDLAGGVSLQGTVTARNSAGVVTVRTVLGTLSFAGPTTAVPGATVAFQLQGGQQAQVLLSGVSRPATSGVDNGPAVTTPQTLTNAPAPTPGLVTGATIVQQSAPPPSAGATEPAPPAPTPAQPPAPAQSGSQVAPAGATDAAPVEPAQPTPAAPASPAPEPAATQIQQVSTAPAGQPAVASPPPGPAPTGQPPTGQAPTGQASTGQASTGQVPTEPAPTAQPGTAGGTTTPNAPVIPSATLPSSLAALALASQEVTSTLETAIGALPTAGSSSVPNTPDIAASLPLSAPPSTNAGATNATTGPATGATASNPVLAATAIGARLSVQIVSVTPPTTGTIAPTDPASAIQPARPQSTGAPSTPTPSTPGQPIPAQPTPSQSAPSQSAPSQSAPAQSSTNPAIAETTPASSPPVVSTTAGNISNLVAPTESSTATPAQPPAPSVVAAAASSNVGAGTNTATPSALAATSTASNASATPTATAAVLAGEDTAAGVASSTNAATSAPPITPASLSTAATPNATLVTATVVGTSARGQPILAAGTSLLTLDTAPIPVGSSVVLDLGLDNSKTATTRAANAQTATTSTTIPGLPSLPAALAAAAEVGGTTQAAFAAAVPRIGTHLVAGLLYFIAAARSGDIAQWIGPNARSSIDRARGGRLMKNLADEFKQVGKEPAGEWAGMTIPLATGERIEPIRLYLHRRPPTEDEASKGASREQPIRFLIDLDLSRLGPVQIDGLARPGKLDLVIRTPSPIAQGLRAGLIEAYPNILARNNVTGEIGFLVAPPIRPTIAQPSAKAQRSGILV